MHVPILSHFRNCQNVGLSKHLWLDQTGDRRSHIETTRIMLQHLKFSWWRVSNMCGQALSLRHISTIILSVWLELLDSAGPEAFHYNGRYWLLWPLSWYVPKLAHVGPKKSVNNIPKMVEFWFLFDRQWRMFQLYILAFASWSILVEPRLVSSGNMPRRTSSSLWRPWQIVKNLRLWSPVRCFGNQLAQTSRNTYLSLVILWAKPWPMCRWCTNS